MESASIDLLNGAQQNSIQLDQATATHKWSQWTECVPGKRGNYSLLAAYNQQLNPSEVILANTDRSLSIYDLNKNVVQGFDMQGGHQQKIECICYSSMINADNNNAILLNAVLTASEDKSVKIWDRTSGKVQMKMNYKN